MLEPERLKQMPTPFTLRDYDPELYKEIDRLWKEIEKLTKQIRTNNDTETNGY